MSRYQGPLTNLDDMSGRRRPVMLVLGLASALGASTWFGPWSHKRKGQNDEMYSKLLIVFITLIAAKLVITN